MSPNVSRAWPRPGQRGLVDSTQLALLIPVLLTGLLAIIQASIWFAGRASVQQAAMAGAEHAAFADASPAGGQEVAAQVAARGGLREVSVSVTSDASVVRVVVSGWVVTLLPGDWSQVSAASVRMKEP